MVRSCDEKRGRKLHEKNYDSRGQRTPQSRTTEEARCRHNAARYEVSPIKEKNVLVIERNGEERSEWLTSPLRGINSSLKEIYILSRGRKCCIGMYPAFLYLCLKTGLCYFYASGNTATEVTAKNECLRCLVQ